MFNRYRMGRAWLAGAASVAILAACLGGGGETPATQVFKGGLVVTMDAQRTVAQAVAVRGGNEAQTAAAELAGLMPASEAFGGMSWTIVCFFLVATFFF